MTIHEDRGAAVAAQERGLEAFAAGMGDLDPQRGLIITKEDLGLTGPGGITLVAELREAAESVSAGSP